MENRRRFFNSFAMIRGFDPLVSTNWRDIKQEDVVREKVFFVLFFIYLFGLFLLLFLLSFLLLLSIVKYIIREV